MKLDPDDPTKISSKLDENGWCLGFKARLVYQGSKREVGIDHTYTEVYSTVLKVRSVRIVLSCALNHDDYLNIRIHHENLKTAFLSAELNKVVFMNYPKGIKNPGNKVLRVVRALYGLPESMRIFTDHLNRKLLGMGFVQSKADNAIYVLQKGKSFVWLPVFVDDMFIAENDKDLYKFVMDSLEKDFTISHLGELKYALGIRFNINLAEGFIEMDQQAQKERLIEISGLENCKPTKAPFQKGMVLEKLDCLATSEDIKAQKTFEYRRKVGKIGYIVACSDPAIAYGFTQLARHSQNPRIIHYDMNACTHLIRYIASTIDSKLRYTRQDPNKRACIISTMADSSYADDKRDFKSHTGALGFMYGNLVWWLSRRQTMVATSTFMAETMASYEASREMIWQRRILEELGMPELGPSVMWQDNQGVIQNTYNNTKHDATKHINVKYYFKRERLQAGELILDYLNTKNMLADSLSKSVDSITHKNHKDIYMGYEDMSEKNGVATGKTPQCTKAYKV